MLHGIAMRFYNNGTQYKKLLGVNREKLPTARNLRPGMVLDIPR